jgi:uncharacterized OB-fold protein
MAARDDDFYWEGLAQGELRVRVCTACGRGAFPPAPGCPHCGDESSAVVVSSGVATLYTWTVCHVAFAPELAAEVPYVVGVVDLPEGARIVARLEEVAPSELRDGMAVRVRWPADRAGERLVFVPAGGSEN